MRRESFKRIILAFLLIVCNFSLHSSINISSKVSKDKITIGDHILYSVIIDHDNKIKVDYPNIAENLGVFEVKDFDRKIEKKEENTIYRVNYEVSTYTLGKYVVPPLKVKYWIDGISNEILTSCHTVEVISVPRKASDIDDIRDIRKPLSLTQKPVWKSWFLVTVLAILIIFMIRKLLWKNTYIEEETIEIQIPYTQKIEEEINQLKNDPFHTRERCKEFYIRVTDIIKLYLHKRYFMDTFEKTTTEMKLEFNKVNKEIDLHQKGILLDIMNESDMVKFAKLEFEPETYQKSLKLFEEFYWETKEKEDKTEEVIYQEEEEENDI